MDKIVNDMVAILHEMDDPMGQFKKNTYADMFDKFKTIHKDTIKGLEAVILDSDNRDEKMKELAEGFTCEIECEFSAIKKKRFRDNKLMDYNMAFVTYYFPAILDLNPETGKDFLETFIKVWKTHFPTTDLKLATFEEINAGFKQRYCYITTAVCESLGKPDDCYELNLLRNYRDGYLSSQDNGEELIKRYYDIAPTIVKRINRKAESHEIYKNIWKTYLKPCIHSIEDGNNASCMQLYTDMVYDLQDKYFS